MYGWLVVSALICALWYRTAFAVLFLLAQLATKLRIILWSFHVFWFAASGPPLAIIDISPPVRVWIFAWPEAHFEIGDLLDDWCQGTEYGDRWSGQWLNDKCSEFQVSRRKFDKNSACTNQALENQSNKDWTRTTLNLKSEWIVKVFFDRGETINFKFWARKYVFWTWRISVLDIGRFLYPSYSDTRQLLYLDLY